MSLEKIRHSASHVLAAAVKKLFPKAKLGMGPAIEDGFYYDFDDVDFREEDLPKIEKMMQEIINKNLLFKKIKVSRKNAEKLLKGQKYKLELLKELKNGEISFYKMGDFIDLCKGPHVKATNEIKAFKLLRLAGAYWRGDSKNKMLQRIYGTAFDNEKDLKEFLKIREEAEQRDHRRIGKELELFFFDELSPGSPFFDAKGTIVYNLLVDFLRGEYRKRGYKEVITPQIFDRKLWETSGHWEHFKDDMFILNMDDREAALKPMNCPSHIVVFKNRTRSYRELPLRLADFGVLHRNELKGVIGGLTRVRKFQQDDAHIFVTEDQIEEELVSLIEFIDYIFVRAFNFKYSVNLSTKPDKAIGDPKLWKKAEVALEKALKKKGINYSIKKGEGAFYGPKADFEIKDAIGRNWQLSTVQVDFNMPIRFKAVYEGKDGRKHSPVMIHRALLGSLERFIGILLEHYAGKLPLWLNPVQVIFVTVTDRNISFAKEIAERFMANDIRVELDDRSESIAKKVNDAHMQSPNYIITIGDKEVNTKTLAVRDRENKVRFNVDVIKFIDQLSEDIANRK